MALTDTAIRKIKPTEKSFKITDSAGLYLLIKPNGSKLWYMKYRVDGKEKKLIDEKEKKLAFGPYAVKKQLIRSNPAQNLDGEFTPPETQHYPALPLEKLSECLPRTDN
ncbi:Arm DNA-binding domain-containing protein [Salmonella enterica]|uniref:Arm DNA-binding domain-containing protein n=1 Tax=Salmonella enterica TaxID=28901 RepID=UPI000326E636|nr:Arm DNA-binding domain-containing protein [Salmonella enterica]CCT52538.1 IntB [Salmonella enterica subsp. enterica serovar Agona str. 11.A.05]